MPVAKRPIDPRKSRIALLFGGPSVEHEVSLVSARGVARGLREAGLDWFPVAVTRDGGWLDAEASARYLDGDARAIPGDAPGGRLLVAPGDRSAPLRREPAPGGATSPVAADVVFPLLHGWGGEDGRLQGLLDWLGLPCVGSGVLGSALGMDKVRARRAFEAAGLEVGPWLAFGADEIEEPDGAVARVVGALRAPWFVKPANGGSSIGIRRVTEESALPAALAHAAEYDTQVLVEQGIDAREIECAVVGNERPVCAPAIGEIESGTTFYDYDAKYVSDVARLTVPADLPEATADALRASAVRAYRALGLSGYARVDFLVERDLSHLWINEVNTLPGFTPISMFPKLWEASGTPFPKLLEELVRLAR